MFRKSSIPGAQFKAFDQTKPARPLASLKTDDIPGAKPQNKCFDQTSLIERYKAKLAQSQEKDLARSMVPPYPLDRQNEDMSALKSDPAQITVSEPNELRRAANESLKGILGSPTLYSPQQSRKIGQTSELKNHSGYASIGQMRNPMFSDFDFQKYELPHKKVPPKQYLYYIPDSLDMLKREYDEKSPNGNQSTQDYSKISIPTSPSNVQGKKYPNHFESITNPDFSPLEPNSKVNNEIQMEAIEKEVENKMNYTESVSPSFSRKSPEGFGFNQRATNKDPNIIYVLDPVSGSPVMRYKSKQNFFKQSIDSPVFGQ